MWYSHLRGKVKFTHDADTAPPLIGWIVQAIQFLSKLLMKVHKAAQLSSLEHAAVFAITREKVQEQKKSLQTLRLLTHVARMIWLPLKNH